jgi:hypothetical protein
MKLSELAGAIDGVTTKMRKIKGEVEKLKASTADVQVPSEAQQAFDQLTAFTQETDDLNPDQP